MPMVSPLQTHPLASTGSYDATTLRGKSVLITGGASGIGEACVRAFVRAGAFVTFGDINAERGNALVSELGASNAAFAQCDTRSWEQQLALFKLAIERAPARTVDVVHANAGIATSDDMQDDQTDEGTGEPVKPDLAMSGINYDGVLYTVRLALHYFGRQPQGDEGSGARDRCLVLTGSMASYYDAVSILQYHGSKFGVRGLMRCLRRTMPEKGGRVNVIAPWYIQTRLVPEEGWNEVRKSIPKFALVEDVAESVLHLAADKTLNGRGIATVPRSINERGYLDINMDDNDDDAIWAACNKLQEQE